MQAGRRFAGTLFYLIFVDETKERRKDVFCRGLEAYEKYLFTRTATLFLPHVKQRKRSKTSCASVLGYRNMERAVAVLVFICSWSAVFSACPPGSCLTVRCQPITSCPVGQRLDEQGGVCGCCRACIPDVRIGESFLVGDKNNTMFAGFTEELEEETFRRKKILFGECTVVSDVLVARISLTLTLICVWILKSTEPPLQLMSSKKQLQIGLWNRQFCHRT